MIKNGYMKANRRNEYRMKNHLPKNLLELGFKNKYNMSSGSCKYCSIKFPVVKYNESSSIIGEIVVDSGNGDTYVNVFGLRNEPYAPYYDSGENGCKDILSIINRNITKKMKELGIKKTRR